MRFALVTYLVSWGGIWAFPSLQCPTILHPPPSRRWVTSFERTNLTFSVHRREGLGSVVQQLVEAKRRGGGSGDLEPTLVYTNTTGQVEEVADCLEKTGLFNGKVSRCPLLAEQQGPVLRLCPCTPLDHLFS